MSNIEEATKYKTLGNEAFSAKRYEEAIENFTKAIELNPNDHVFYSNRSASYASLEEYEKALEDATKCVTLKPDWSKGYTRKGLAEFYLDKLDDAEATYNKGLEIEPTNAGFKEGLDRIKETRESGGAEGLNGNFMQQAFGKLLANPETAGYFSDPDFTRKIMEIQKNPQAIGMYMSDPKIQKAFQVILSDFGGAGGMGGMGGMPGMPGAGGMGGMGGFPGAGGAGGAGEGMGGFPGAGGMGGFPGAGGASQSETKPEEPRFESKPQQKEAPKTSSKNTNPADDEKNKGNDEYKKKNFDQAIVHYQRAIELDGTEPIYYNNLAAVYVELKQYDKAIEACEKAEEVCKSGKYDYIKYAKILARKAAAYGHKGDVDTALQFYEKSLLENNDTKVKDEKRKLEKARKDKEEKEYINPEVAEQHRLKGNELYGQAKYPDAIKEYDEAIKRNPTEAKLYANRGTALMKLMEYPMALRDIDRCLELDPSYVKAYAKKGVIHHFLKEYHKALESYEKGLKIEPANEECRSGVEKTRHHIMSASGSETKEDQAERLKRAMEDPEVRSILQDPQTMQLLRDLQERPQDPTNMAALRDPTVAKKIDKLIAAGVLRMG